MGFEDALRKLKCGFKVTRKGWNGKEQYIELGTDISYRDSDGDMITATHKSMGNNAIVFVGTSGIQVGWLASQADMLSEDWVVVE